MIIVFIFHLYTDKNTKTWYPAQEQQALEKKGTLKRRQHKRETVF